MTKRNVSGYISFLLRHEPWDIDLQMDVRGWVCADALIEGINRKKGCGLDRALLEEIVREDRKGRYRFSEDGSKIKACQGHSIPWVIPEMEFLVPPEFLYHGTATRFLDTIMKDGLKPMTRQFVHISPDYETAVKVGSRHGKPVVLKIRAKDFVDDGNELYRSSNGVWQARCVPPVYFTICYTE